MTRRISFSRQAAKDLRSIVDRTTVRRLSDAIKGLAEHAYPSGARKLKSAGEVWRVRVGDWRVCYAIKADEHTVVILTIAHRGDVYKRLRRRLG